MVFMCRSEENLRKPIVSFFCLNPEIEFRLPDSVARSCDHSSTTLDLHVHFRRRFRIAEI